MLQSFLHSRGKNLSLAKPLVMGVLNVTPDSFSDGGKYPTVQLAVDAALQMVVDGADIIDIGGESSGPGSVDVLLEEELRRVMPVIEELRSKTEAWISVDTYKSEVARQALDAGVDMVNDVTALRGDAAMGKVLAGYEVPVVMMYSKDPTARTTVAQVLYDDVIATIRDFLMDRIQYGVSQGISNDRFILDPGMGAFVSLVPDFSLKILKDLRIFTELGLPVLVGASRKGFIGKILNVPVGERLEGGLACAAVAVMNGASIIRTHDVKSTRRLVDMIHALQQS